MWKKLLLKLLHRKEVKKEVKPIPPVRKVEWEQLTLPLD